VDQTISTGTAAHHRAAGRERTSAAAVQGNAVHSVMREAFERQCRVFLIKAPTDDRGFHVFRTYLIRNVPSRSHDWLKTTTLALRGHRLSMRSSIVNDDHSLSV